MTTTEIQHEIYRIIGNAEALLNDEDYDRQTITEGITSALRRLARDLEN